MVKTKNFVFVALSVFALMFLMSAVSANIVFTSVSGNGNSVEQGDTAVISFQLTEDTNGGGDATNINFNVPITLTSGANSFNSASSVSGAITSLNQDQTSSLMSLSFSVPSNQPTGTYTGTLQPTGTYTADFEPLTVTLTVTQQSTDLPDEIQDCVNVGNPADLEINSIDFQNNGMDFNTFGKDDEWFPFEEIEVEINVENNGDFDTSNVEISWGLWNIETEEWVIDFDNEDEFDIDEGKDETLTVTFKLDDDLDVDLDELTDGNHYKLYVTAEGEIDDNNADELDGEDTCAYNDDSEGEASIIIERDFVVIDNLNVPSSAQCGESVEIRGQVWNIGDRDQDEVSLLVRYGDFDLQEEIIIGDIDSFDNDQFTFRFEVPRDADEKIHPLRFEVYDEDLDIYQNDFDDDDSIFIVPLTVVCNGGGSGGQSGKVLITANLASGGRAGQNLVVKATITNNDDSLQSFTVNAAEFSQFANSASVDQTTIVLNSRESRDVTLTLDVKRDASGEYTFFIEALSGDGDIVRQPVSVNVQPGGGFLGLTGFTIGGGNTLLWGLGLLNIILVIVIVIVAIRIARK